MSLKGVISGYNYAWGRTRESWRNVGRKKSIMNTLGENKKGNGITRRERFKRKSAKL